MVTQRDECSNRMTFEWVERLESLEGLKAPIREYTSTSEQAPHDRWGLGGVVWIIGRCRGKARTGGVGGMEGGGGSTGGGGSGNGSGGGEGTGGGGSGVMTVGVTAVTVWIGGIASAIVPFLAGRS